MKLQILSQKITHFTLEARNSEDEKKISLNYKIEYASESKNKFTLIFNIVVLSPSEFELRCTYATVFQTSENINEAFKNSDFPKINAPAIVFPFLRVLISNFTLNAGYNPIVLPSINFIALHDKNDERLL